MLITKDMFDNNDIFPFIFRVKQVYYVEVWNYHSKKWGNGSQIVTIYEFTEGDMSPCSPR